MSTDPSEYEKAMPAVEAALRRLERAVGRTRACFAGRPYGEVRRALVAALDDEGAKGVPSEVVHRIAEMISEEGAEG
ncbi:hypothetical protein ACGFRB_10635 [Streptomyces sp. NPDC048718]|uniref:hypothetical protein n=1 Tax=Streptomyces sp. NPDC048718 TaxID=3365587 RepID=UPI003720CD4A